ncbi:MAG: hypothetical protein K9K66_05345 [Desulfarculaceae bacterium]|nr:hypothetical protein [Desulfarculaceae bacterium]MCF8072897.1 hypothetical protein [Desulfarculaceae bacterium]MCF8101065.1 hypothetical protein [Desulfarculaceae bacterium]MCF8115548.1 hypothetical protein [Desulfarculaceae bacterium]
MPELEQALERARELSHAAHGPNLDIFLPGMFTAYGRTGRYPAVSITGKSCSLGCDHCRGRLLRTMRPARDADQLYALGLKLAAQGQEGMLLSGGSDPQGHLPWDKVLPAIERLSADTELILTAHVGRIDRGTAKALKQAGVRQALVDVVGSEGTAQRVLHLADGLAGQSETLAACQEAGLELAPHIILGLDHGHLHGEEHALELVAELEPKRVVFVVLMPLKGTPLAQATPPSPQEVAGFLAQARERLPRIRHHLGCARPRGRHRRELDALAVRAGINALAIPSDGALDQAREMGVKVSFRDTCCSLA